MAFTILDNDEVFNTNQAIWMQTDINAIIAGIGGDGVVSGCAVTAQGSPDMTVAVAVGVVKVGATVAAVSAGNVTITTADATNPRIDLIVVSNAGVKSCTAGTAAANPKAPDIPASSVLLAMVYVPAADTTIATNQITDKRNILDSMFAMWHPVADADYTIIAGDRVIAYTSITTARTLTLPAASSLNAGQELIIVDVSGSLTGTITIPIARAGSDTINGGTSSFVLARAYGVVRLISDGTSKWIASIVGATVIVHTSTNATWTPPTAAFYDFLSIGGGGGGRSGARGASGVDTLAGGGGGGGGLSRQRVRTSDLSAGTWNVVVGAGGSGGAAQTGDSSAGIAGSSGGASGVVVGSATFAQATGGSLGGAPSGGAAGGGELAGGAAGQGGQYGGGAGGTAGGLTAGGGGGGGAITSANAAGNGATGGGNTVRNLSGGTAGTSGAAGGAGTAGSDLAGAGCGGGGGGASTSAAAGTGGAGGAYGGGGGGGAASRNGNNSGAGGAGGAGVVIVIAWP